MTNAIFIETNKQLTLEQYVPIAAETMSLIADTTEGLNKIVETFSVAELSVLLNQRRESAKRLGGSELSLASTQTQRGDVNEDTQIYMVFDFGFVRFLQFNPSNSFRARGTSRPTGI
jgi:hypothetical protein